MSAQALAFQFVFVVIATDPLRYRSMIVAAILEKASYAVAVAVLVNQGRMSGGPVFGGVMDLVLGVLFVVSYVALTLEARRVT